MSFVGGHVAGDQLRMHTRLTAGANTVETVVFKLRVLGALLFFPPIEILCKCTNAELMLIPWIWRCEGKRQIHILLSKQDRRTTGTIKSKCPIFID